MQVAAPCFSAFVGESICGEVRIEATAERDAGNQSAGLGALLNDLGLEKLGIGTACCLHEISA